MFVSQGSSARSFSRQWHFQFSSFQRSCSHLYSLYLNLISLLNSTLCYIYLSNRFDKKIYWINHNCHIYLDSIHIKRLDGPRHAAVRSDLSALILHINQWRLHLYISSKEPKYWLQIHHYDIHLKLFNKNLRITYFYFFFTHEKYQTISAKVKHRWR